MNPYYKDYQEYLAEIFPGEKIQKISVNAGFSCPNRDGTIGTGGCIYCDNTSFTPSYCFEGDSVKMQLEKGKIFFSRKYPQMRYLAYFQSFTNTFRGTSVRKGTVEELKSLYQAALEVEQVAGLIIGSRPDCFSEELIAMLVKLNQQSPVFVEIGAESSHDSTLATINRGHDWKTVEMVVRQLAEAGIRTGLHLIMGLPGEKESDMLETVDRSCGLPIDSVKFHHLQVIAGTRLSGMVRNGQLRVEPWDVDDYLKFCCRIVERVPKHIAIERFLASAPPAKVESPRWGLKNYEFTAKLHKLLASTNVKDK